MEKIEFEFETEHGVFKDAIYLPEDHQLTQEEIDIMKNERLNNWLSHIETTSLEESAPAQPNLDNPEDYITINGVQYKKV